MSQVIVEIKEIDNILPHSNADLLEIAVIGGWRCVVPKGKYAAGNKIIYIPPDCILPTELSDKIGVTKYLSNGRVKAAKLRGEVSFGIVMDIDDDTLEEGVNLAESFGITKYFPPVNFTAGDREKEISPFIKYTEIENLRHFHRLLEDGEEVVISEKIHGTNSRIGIVDGEEMAGSHKFRRKKPEVELDELSSFNSGTYWFPWTIPGVSELMHKLGEENNVVILFGEIYASSIQKGFSYNTEPGKLGYRAFDLFINGKYLDYDEFKVLCDQYGVETVPLLYRGPYSLEKVVEVCNGVSTLNKNHIKEGGVIKPVIERIHSHQGRVILKYKTDDFLTGKNIPDSTDE